MPPPIRYTRSGDINLAYQVVGSGTTDLVWCLGSYSHLDVLWESPHFARLFERVGQFARVLLFDRRGVGLSDRFDRLQTLDERIDDVRAVMDAVGTERACILGLSEGGSMAMLFAATYPGRTSGLILHGTQPRWSRTADWPYGRTREEFETRWRALAEANYENDPSTPAFRRWCGPALHDDPSFVEWWRRLVRSMASPTGRYQQQIMNLLLDVRDVLPAIQAPTLILNREDDPVAPLEAVRWMASRISLARLTVLPGQGHLIGPDIFEEWIAAVEEFVTGVPRPVSSDRFLTTLVSADIANSTELVSRIGDATWREVLARHYELVARRLAIHSGVEVDRAGDGFLARFDGPARAVRFARDIDREDRAIGLRARAAVHTGEVERDGDALRGMTVHVASRLTSLAAPGEVVVSSTVKDLVSGAGFEFVDRGLHVLKGVPEARQVFALA